MTSTNIARMLYSAFRNAMAPSSISLAILTIRSDPGSCFATQADFTKVKMSAIMPSQGII